jgi:hypothetical protein
MAVSPNGFALEKFQEYRAKYELLKSVYEKKGREIRSNEARLKVKGETFFSDALMSELFDFAFHNCGKITYPENLTPNNSLDSTETVLSDEQREILKKLFTSISYDKEPINAAFDRYRGLWVRGLSEELIKRKKNLNISGQHGDILSLASSEFEKLIRELPKTKEFKKIEYQQESGYVFDPDEGTFSKDFSTRSLDPRERSGEISKYLLHLYIEEHFKCLHFDKSICRLCGDEFYPQTVHEWPGRVPPDYCSVCLEMSFSGSTEFFRLLGFTEEERRDNFVQGIKIYTEYFGFIPRVGTAKRKVLAQLHDSGVVGDDLDMALRVSSLLPWHETAKEMFGSWAHLLEAAGLLEHRQRGRGGHQSIGSDGHLCLSMGERAICEFLTKRAIDHSKEPMYPSDEKLNPNGLLRADFKVGPILIEFAGMMADKEYAERMNIKSKLAKKYKIPWVKVESSQLEDLDLMLQELNSFDS